MKTIATFNETDQADHVIDRLKQEGVTAELVDESTMQKMWFISKPLADKKIKVEEQDFERAKEILAGLDATEDLLHDAIRCPQCNSSRIEYPQFTRKFLTPSLVEIFCVLPFVGREFYCQDCQFTFPTSEKIEPPLDPLGWPKKE